MGVVYQEIIDADSLDEAIQSLNNNTVQSISFNKNLREGYINNGEFEAFSQALEQNNSLIELSLKNISLDWFNYQRFFKSLKNIAPLKYLSLQYYLLDAKSMGLLVRALGL